MRTAQPARGQGWWMRFGVGSAVANLAIMSDMMRGSRGGAYVVRRGVGSRVREGRTHAALENIGSNAQRQYDSTTLAVARSRRVSSTQL